MIVEFSHIAAFSVLFVAAVWDLRTTEVPDLLSVTGVILGIAIHGAASYFSGSVEPLLWSLGIGALFSIYGWGMYFIGMWGGADAFGMSVLGFAAPYGLSGPGLMHPVNLFLNVMIAGLVYTLSYAVYLTWREKSVLAEVGRKLEADEKKVSMEIVAAALVSALMIFLGLSGLRIFGFLMALILLYRFLRVLEDRAMVETVAVEELSGGEVIGRNGEVDRIKERNIIGKALNLVKEKTGTDFVLEPLETRLGYSEVVGVTEEEIQGLKEQGVEEVEVRHGVRFVPVFPVALLVTDVVGGGLAWALMIS